MKTQRQKGSNKDRGLLFYNSTATQRVPYQILTIWFSSLNQMQNY
jgi:hypothetical protein